MLQGGLVLTGALLVMAYLDGSGSVSVAAPAPTTTTAAPTTTSSPTTTSAPAPLGPIPAVASPPPVTDPYVVPDDEIEPDVKQLATDVVYSLTTYEEGDDPSERFMAVAGTDGANDLAEAGHPLTHLGQWSRSEVIYPQMGGLRNGKASVMVVARQTVGSGAETDHSVVRTLDVRLVEGETGWEFDELASAGGVFDDLGALGLAHAVASDPRIEMPDSARLDILAGEISPELLELMADLAEFTPYGITVMATGHPYHVFETDRVSHHTIGRAIDIHQVGGVQVVDDRAEGSMTRAVVTWLLDHPSVAQVGSPWDFDGSGSSRSFADVVHQDHIHVAVIGG